MALVTSTGSLLAGRCRHNWSEAAPLSLTTLIYHYQEETWIVMLRYLHKHRPKEREGAVWIRTQWARGVTLEASSAPTVDLWREHR